MYTLYNISYTPLLCATVERKTDPYRWSKATYSLTVTTYCFTTLSSLLGMTYVLTDEAIIGTVYVNKFQSRFGSKAWFTTFCNATSYIRLDSFECW